MGRVADNGAGIIDQRHGATGSADMMRIMDPTHGTLRGYARDYNNRGQPLDLFGKPGERASTHIPLDYEGPIPGQPR
jgi:hypothetical protein